MKVTVKKKCDYKLNCESDLKSVIGQLAKEKDKPTINETPHTQAIASGSLLSTVNPTSRIGFISRFIIEEKDK
jgi:hypothetical protein